MAVMHRKCVYLGTHGFDSNLRVGSHHLAKDLARKFGTVTYLAHPISLPTVLAKWSDTTCARLRNYVRGGTTLRDCPLTCYVPGFAVAPGTQFPLNTSLVLNHAWKTSFPKGLSEAGRISS